MKNFKFGTVMGIPIYANLTLVLFLPVLAWLISQPAQIDAYAGLIEVVSGQDIPRAALTEGSTPILIGVGGAVGLMFGVLVHELGHSWMARRYDIVITSITLWIFGGMARMEELPEDWHIEFWVALAGPVTSLLLSVVFFAGLQVTPASAPVLTFVVGWLAVVNLSLAIFNMLPAFPMDGGRILRALLARRGNYATATQRAASVGKLMAVGLALVAIFGTAPLLILIALFVYVAASSEARATVLRELLRGYTARDLMHRDVTGISPDATAADLVERTLDTKRTAYPVVTDRGDVVGFVRLGAALNVDEVERDAVLIEDIMSDGPERVAPDADAFEVMVSMGQSASSQVVVFDGESFLGVIGNEDVLETIQLLQGIGPTDRNAPRPDGYA